MYLAKILIAPAINLSINRYSHTPAHLLSIIYLQLKLSVEMMQEAGETLTHSVLLFLHSLIPTCFHCIDCHQQLFSVSVRFPCRSNQSGNIWRNTHIPLQYTFQIVDEVAIPNVRFTVCCPIVFGVICIVQVPIPVKPIIHCRNVFRCAVLRMTVDSSDSANISYLSWSSRAVLCRQSWWPRRSF